MLLRGRGEEVTTTHQSIDPRDEHIQCRHNIFRDRFDEKGVKFGRIKLVGNRSSNIETFGNAWR